MAQQGRTIGVKELKAHTSEVLRQLQETGGEVIVTVHGRPVARIEAFTEVGAVTPTDGMGGMRDSWAALPAAEWEDFEEAKRAWEPRDPDAD